MPTHHFILSQTPQTTTEHQVFVLMPDRRKLFYGWIQNGALLLIVKVICLYSLIRRAV